MSKYWTLGSLAISDKDLKRIETVAANASRDADKIVDKATGAIGKVRGALVANAVVTGLSTAVIVGVAIKAHRRTL